MGCAATKGAFVGSPMNCFTAKPALMTREELIEKKKEFHEEYDNLLNRISDYQQGYTLIKFVQFITGVKIRYICRIVRVFGPLEVRTEIFSAGGTQIRLHFRERVLQPVPRRFLRALHLQPELPAHRGLPQLRRVRRQPHPHGHPLRESLLGDDRVSGPVLLFGNRVLRLRRHHGRQRLFSPISGF